MLGGILVSEWTFTSLFVVISFLTLWEYGGLVFEKEPEGAVGRKLILLLLGIAPFAAFCALKGLANHQAPLMLASTLLLAPIVLLYELFHKSSRPFENVGLSLLTIPYIAGPYALVLYLGAVGSSAFSPWLVLAVLLMVWANDVFAYFIGSQIGKTKLFERISPKKTWEGSIGGFICCMLVGAGAGAIIPATYIPFELHWIDWMAIGGICSVFGSLGDLVESMLKRSLGVKDSGTLLPGHGGLLDRFDAFMFVVPFVAFYVMAFAG